MAEEPYRYPAPLWGLMVNDDNLGSLSIKCMGRRALTPTQQENTFWPTSQSEWHTLRLAIIQNSTVREVRFSNNIIETRTKEEDKLNQRLFFGGLKKNVYITKLHLYRCRLDHCMITQLNGFLKKSNTLLELHINRCSFDNDCEELFAHDESNTTIGDNAMSMIVESINENPTKILRNLDLYGNRGLRTATINSCAKLISDHSSNLHSIALDGSILDDDTVCILVNAIAQNKQSKLEHLNMTPIRTSLCQISNVGWGAFSKLLCDPSSINDTYNSNHILSSLGYTNQLFLECGCPPELLYYLDWNEMGIGKDLKILKTHFVDNFNLDYFKDVPLNVMPHFLSWLGNAPNLSMSSDGLYSFIQHIPGVVGKGTEEPPMFNHKLLWRADSVYD